MQVLDSGIIYRNPKPHVKSVHAYFPSVVKMGNGELLAGFVLAEAFESADMHSHLARSSDGGKTWTYQGELLERKAGGVFSDSMRLTALGGGDVAAFIVRCNRTDHPGEGLANPENMGFVPTELLLSRSSDFGKTFSKPEPIEPSVVGPEFELCSSIVVLSDGTWAWPTSTWKAWDGEAAGGMRMVALVSDDRGKSWPRHWEVMQNVPKDIIYWESKIVELADEGLIALAWGYDNANGADLPNQFAISRDKGASWSQPASAGIFGQTVAALLLPGGDVLCIYRRVDVPGLWASKCAVRGESFEVLESAPMWGAGASGLTTHSDDMVHNFNVLRFGAPCCFMMDDNTVFAAFWCYEDCVSNIRWIKLGV